jgi:hypothetical protein
MTKPRKRRTTRGKKTSPQASSSGSSSASFSTANADFWKKLAAQPHVKFLTKAESDALIADTDFDGCIARPKNWKYEGPDSEDEETPQV